MTRIALDAMGGDNAPGEIVVGAVESALGLGDIKVLLVGQLSAVQAELDKLPKDLEESAMVDGCTRLDSFLRIMLPLSVPGLITATLLTFIASWNNFIFGLILGTSKTQPLPVAVFSFISYTEVNWGGMMAASVVITLPIIIICMLLQKYIISGLTAGAVKG